LFFIHRGNLGDNTNLMPKKSKTQDYLENQVIFKHGGIIDLKKLWAKEDVEADPKVIENLIKNANTQTA